MRWPQPVWTRFLPTQTVLNLATLGAVGRRLPAPGTWGSVAGLFFYTVIYAPFEPGTVLWADLVKNLIISAVAGYIAVGLCGEAEFRMGRKDPGEVILDEFVAIPFAFSDGRRFWDPCRCGRSAWSG